MLTFPAPLPKEVSTALRGAGFRFSKVLHHWEGLSRLADAEALARQHGGAARRVASPPPPASASATALDTAAE